MLKAIILECEENSRTLLSGFLNDHCPDVKLLAAVDTVQAGLDAINAFHPDIVFMEIVLKDGTSLDLMNRLPETDFDIIFTTVNDNYLYRAIKLSAVDYLLKPINLAELKSAVLKAKMKREKILSNKNLQALINNIKYKYKDHQVAIPILDGYILLKVSNIMYLESKGAYTYVFLKNEEKLITTKNIKEYEDLLSDHNFFRIHKSFMVNIFEITHYMKGNGGYVIMSNKIKLDVSRRRKDEFLKRLNKL